MSEKKAKKKEGTLLNFRSQTEDEIAFDDKHRLIRSERKKAIQEKIDRDGTLYFDTETLTPILNMEHLKLGELIFHRGAIYRVYEVQEHVVKATSKTEHVPFNRHTGIRHSTNERAYNVTPELLLMYEVISLHAYRSSVLRFAPWEKMPIDVLDKVLSLAKEYIIEQGKLERNERWEKYVKAQGGDVDLPTPEEWENKGKDGELLTEEEEQEEEQE